VLRFKRTAPLRWLKHTDRELVVELCKSLANKMREANLREEIKSLGGFAKPHRWKEKNRKAIIALREELRKVRRETAVTTEERRRFHELRQLVGFKGCYTPDHAPHYLASHLKVNVLVIYRVLRKFAETGDVRFNNELTEQERIERRENRHKRGTNGLTHAAAPKCKRINSERSKALSRKSPYYRDEIDNDIPPTRKPALRFVLDEIEEYVAARFKSTVWQVRDTLAEYQRFRCRDTEIAIEVFSRLKRC